MAKLDEINTGIPVGRDKVSDDPRKQREIRTAITSTFGTEHHLTGEHKFPNGTSPNNDLKDGQIHFDTTNGLLSFKRDDQQTGEVFPIGSVRDFVIGELWGYGSMSTAGLLGYGQIPAFAGRRIAGDTATDILTAQVGLGALGKTPAVFSSKYLAHTYTATPTIGRINLTGDGIYKVSIYLGYFTSTTTSAGVFRLVFTGISGSATAGESTTIEFNGFTTNAYVRPGPQAGVLTPDAKIVDTITVTGDYDLVVSVLNDANLGITSLGLRIERIG